MENIAAKIGLEPQSSVVGQRLRTYINLKLAAIGCRVPTPRTWISQ
jgi:hypothetical protein